MGDNSSERDFDQEHSRGKEKQKDQDLESTGSSQYRGLDLFSDPQLDRQVYQQLNGDGFEQQQLLPLQVEGQSRGAQFWTPDHHSQGIREGAMETESDETQQKNVKPQVWMNKNLNSFMVKNVNMPKFFLRIFMRNLGKYEWVYENKQSFIAARRMSQRMDQFAKEDKRNYLSLRHLQQLFTDGDDGDMDYLANRKAMHFMLRNQLGKEIFKNTQVKHKLSYAVATKTYALRCFNAILASRVQSR